MFQKTTAGNRKYSCVVTVQTCEGSIKRCLFERHIEIFVTFNFREFIINTLSLNPSVKVTTQVKTYFDIASVESASYAITDRSFCF